MSKPLRALLVEDSADDAALLIKELHRAHYAVTCERVETAAALKAALARAPWDIVFCDFTLPRFRGDLALKIVQESGLDLPFIYVSGTIGEDIAVQAMKAGAHDYVMKSHLARLAPAVARELRQVQVRRQVQARDITGQPAPESPQRGAQKTEVLGQIAGVAHDFNNLLAVIRGNAEVMAMDASQHGAATGECLQQIIAATERAAGLTRQLLTFHRKQIMRHQPLDLNEATANLVKMLGRIMGEGIRLRCTYDAKPSFVRADMGMIEQVLVNLAINARDAMPRGGQLHIRTERVLLDEHSARAHPEGRAGEFIRLTVADTGTGIAPEHLPHIFNRFFTTKAPGKGDGLGLATVYGIVKQHQGWIEVSNRPGAGASFDVFLPAIAPPRSAAGPRPNEKAPRGGAEKILLVEDEAAVRLPVRRILETAGYDVREAACGREALEIWRAGDWEADLLLTDVYLPDGLTGYELAEQLRSRKPALKAVFISGRGAQAAGKETASGHASKTYFLQKPFPSRALIETVRRCLDEA